MLNLLIAGNKKACSAVFSAVEWEKAGYTSPITATNESSAAAAMEENDFDVLIAIADGNFPWQKILNRTRNISGQVDVILISSDMTPALAQSAVESGAAGLLFDIQGKRLGEILSGIYNRKRSSKELIRILSDSNISEDIFYHLNGNDVPYFEDMFQSLRDCGESKEFIRAVCEKLMGIIYSYLDDQGFKNAGLQRTSAIHSLSELNHISDVIDFTRARYINIFQFETEKNQDYYYALSESIKEYIKNNFTGEALGVPKIAERFHFSANYINGIFKSQVGETIPSYISNLRLSYAKKLLTETKEPISEIAVKVGYSRVTYFSRIFKRKYNISPIEYRNKFSK